MKKILCLLGISLFSSLTAREFWQCNYDGSIHCPNKTQTCCRSKVQPSGFECFNFAEAVCCSNGIGACPKNYICDIDNGRCLPKTMTFLSDDTLNENNNNQTSIIPTIKENPVVDLVQFTNGFFSGFGFFDHASDNSTCYTNQEFFNETLNIINKLKDIKIDQNLPNFLEGIVNQILDKKDLFIREFQQCQLVFENTEAVVEKLINHLSQPDYIKRIGTHTILYLGEIKESLARITTEFNQKEYEKVGVESGKLLKFLIFWDLK